MRSPTGQTIAFCVPLFFALISMYGNQKERPAVLEFLTGISGTAIVAGIHNREPNSRPALQTDQIVKTTGRYPGLWSGDFLFKSDDINSRWAMIFECRNQWDGGAMVNLMLHVAPPNQPEACEWVGGVLSRFTDEQWKDLTTEGGELNRLWKVRLDEYAKYLLYLQQCGVQVMFRPFHEMNQGKFWWGGRPGPQGTAKLYRLTRDYLEREKGLTTLIWVWDMQDMSRDFEAYNPGADYWDLFAFDIYADGYDQTWYDYIVKVVGNKLMAIGECSTLPSEKILAAQPRWCFFMSWAELTFTDNSEAAIRALYESPRVLTRDKLPKFRHDDAVTGPTRAR